MEKGTWILERTQNSRFPYRLQILTGDGPWIVLRTQDRWPAAGRHIFCLREENPPMPDEKLEEIERVDIIAFNERGKRVSVVLDRKRYKRCDFLFLEKTYKNRSGESYEQIFWLTQRAIEQHRPSFRLVTRRSDSEMLVRIDSNERYPWRFPGAMTERGVIPAGDYALVGEESFLAVVERKTLDNLLSDFNSMPVLHQRLAELAVQDNHAMVIEAAYADFLNPKKVHHYNPGFCAKAIAEMFAFHPNLRIIFCSNRKTANEWTRNFFSVVHNLQQENTQRHARKTE
ncbi:MAG: ERCC4 domain-containing protein [Dehalococcoidales bacterium]|nr:ERCC4 domain-containing protein [Dehalococcoidales bacterium]